MDPCTWRYQGWRLLPTTMILIAYSRAKAKIVLATSWPRNVMGMPPSCCASSRCLAEQALGGRVDTRQVFERRLNVNGVPGNIEPVGDPRRLAQERGAFGLRLESPTITRSVAESGY